MEDYLEPARDCSRPVAEEMALEEPMLEEPLKEESGAILM
jgi:hypothetical protein